MEEFSKSNNRSMANIGGLSIIQEFSMKSCAFTRVDHGKSNVVQTGCTDGNQGAPVDLNKVIRLVEILKQCQKFFTRKEFKNLLKHRAVRSSLSGIADLYNKGRISLEKNAINCIISFLRLIKKRENSCKKNKSNGETTKNKLELKLSVMIADLKMKSTSRDLIPRGGRTPCNKRQESSSQASISTRNITGRKPRRKSLSKSMSRSRSRSPPLRRNLFPRRDHYRPSPPPKRKNSYSRYRRSGSWSPLSSSRSRSRSRSHSPLRKRDYFDSRESRSRFRDHPFKYYEESSTSKWLPRSKRPKSPAGLIREKIHPNRRSRRSWSPSMASLKREVDMLRIENQTALKDLRELLAHNYSSSSSTTHDVGVPSNVRQTDSISRLVVKLKGDLRITRFNKE
ncbi:unnamed protein product [Bemisia tabaci]|uniref:Uncharacterized protein n=1 Tax=Bemisia tabaci TaxID=7038 RepID=A0A9P0F907_BEMTA|nr:unnamed protein product [Bemisia tabaci]